MVSDEQRDILGALFLRLTDGTKTSWDTKQESNNYEAFMPVCEVCIDF